MLKATTINAPLLYIQFIFIMHLIIKLFLKLYYNTFLLHKEQNVKKNNLFRKYKIYYSNYR
jgi:hypothetical protein